MWVFTSTGFISAVRKHDRPNVITVRSRDRRSLEPLVEFAGVDVNVSPFGDYPYRAFIEPEVFTKWVAEQADAIDYDNFKSKVGSTRGYEFTDALHDVWVAMLAVEDSSREELKKLGDANEAR
jgi:hypothetical protein